MGYLRLSAQLLSTTWQQTQLQIDSDLSKMREWAKRFETMVSKQELDGTNFEV